MMCWHTSHGIEIHLHSPAVSSAIHWLYFVHFISVALGESLGSYRCGKYFQQRMAGQGSEGEESTENTASLACIAIMSLLLEYGGRTCACKCFV